MGGTIITDCVKKLKTIEDEQNLLELLKKINGTEQVTLSISKNKIVWAGMDLLSFELDKCGNAQHNAVVVLRDLLNIHYPERNWTHKSTSLYISWGPCS